MADDNTRGGGFRRGSDDKRYDRPKDRMGRRDDRRAQPRGAGRGFSANGRGRGNGTGARDRRSGLRVRHPARDAAVFALNSVIQDGAYASEALDRALRANRMSDEDRALAASLFYTALENRLYLEYVLDARLENRPDPFLYEILHVAAAQLLLMDKVPDHAAVDEAVAQAEAFGRGGMKGFVNGVLRSLARARDAGEIALPDRNEDPQAYLSVRYSMAAPVVRRLIEAWGADEAEAFLAWKPEKQTITVRPNLLRTSTADVCDTLKKSGFACEAGALLPEAIRVSGAGNPARNPGYLNGYFSVQSEGSMLCALAVEPAAGMQILDACAAPGGKTCLMAERMGTSGRVYAWDDHAHRVDLIRSAARRLGLENIRPAIHDARKPMEALNLAMDAVLVDAPCSGLGVVADKPDIALRITDEKIESLVPLQRDILSACAAYVRPGGLLVYSTCTVLQEENAAQVAAFLAAHPEFERDTDVSWLPERLRPYCNDGMLQLLPQRDGVEGFFIARMRRRAL